VELRVVSVAFKGEADLEQVKRTAAAKVPNSMVQAVRAGGITNGALVEMIAAQTIRADGTTNLLARKPEVDLLLRLAGTTQISRAIEQLGARKGEPFLLVIVGRAKKLDSLSWGELGGVELEKRDLTAAELERIEAAALLNVAKA